ncbi:hypothetical protein CLV40_11288 [Actinokineospora auranticolor]|uniref:Uncharacterized protein n=2 Tax=Actinokineospora auranticolor TaxID=155976 RepID=A0A2S6GKR8_9PSEU|nr:hypothetical protein CLV40_11288 [Actinokineospora auranticolor]
MLLFLFVVLPLYFFFRSISPGHPTEVAEDDAWEGIRATEERLRALPVTADDTAIAAAVEADGQLRGITRDAAKVTATATYQGSGPAFIFVTQVMVCADFTLTVDNGRWAVSSAESPDCAAVPISTTSTSS